MSRTVRTPKDPIGKMVRLIVADLTAEVGELRSGDTLEANLPLGEVYCEVWRCTLEQIKRGVERELNELLEGATTG